MGGRIVSGFDALPRRSGSAPFWRSLVTRCAISGIFQPSTRERSPGFAPRFFRTAPSGKTLGASIVVWCSLPTMAGGFITLRSLATLAHSLIHRFNLTAYSSVLCLMAHRTFSRENALPLDYLAR